MYFRDHSNFALKTLIVTYEDLRKLMEKSTKSFLVKHIAKSSIKCKISLANYLINKNRAADSSFMHCLT